MLKSRRSVVYPCLVVIIRSQKYCLNTIAKVQVLIRNESKLYNDQVNYEKKQTLVTER